VFHDNGADENWSVTCAETGLTTGTGGRLGRVRDYVDTDTFMVTYGDGVAEVDVRALLAFHHEQGCIGTVTGVHPGSRYGEITVEGNRALDFTEKPTVAERMVNGGFFVFQREFFSYLGDDSSVSLEHAPLRNLARDGELAVYPHGGHWVGMDTYRDLNELNELWATGQASWKVWSD
jgi:glucose-1-phosphate cytidylyltransferase